MSQSVATPAPITPAAEIQVVLCDNAVGCSATFGLGANRGDGDAKDGAATPSSMPMTPLDRTEVAVCGEPIGDNASGSSSPTGSTAAVPLGDAWPADARMVEQMLADYETAEKLAELLQLTRRMCWQLYEQGVTTERPAHGPEPGAIADIAEIAVNAVMQEAILDEVLAFVRGPGLPVLQRELAREPNPSVPLSVSCHTALDLVLRLQRPATTHRRAPHLSQNLAEGSLMTAAQDSHHGGSSFFTIGEVVASGGREPLPAQLPPGVAPPQQDDAKQQLETLPAIVDHGVTAPAMELDATSQPAQPQPTPQVQVQPPEAAEQVEVPAEQHEPESPKALMPASAQEQEDQSSSGASPHGEVATSMASPHRKRNREEDGAEGEDAVSADAVAVPMPFPGAAEPPVLAADGETNAGTAVPATPSAPADAPDVEAQAVAAPGPEAGEPLPREAAAACEALGSV